MFSENLPSWPDNITPRSGGGYWVGNGIVRSAVLNFFAYNFVSFRSLIAKVSTKIGTEYGIPFQLLNIAKCRSLTSVKGQLHVNMLTG